MPNLEFRCKDDPEVNGRTPLIGEQRFSLLFPLEDGSELRLHMGKEGMNIFAHFIGNMIADDATESEVASGPQGKASEMARTDAVDEGEDDADNCVDRGSGNSSANSDISRSHAANVDPQEVAPGPQEGRDDPYACSFTESGEHAASAMGDCIYCGSKGRPHKMRVVPATEDTQKGE